VSAKPLSLRAMETRLSALYATIFLVGGVQNPFLPVWLGALGFSTDQIGWLMAAPRGLQAVLLPVVTHRIDRGGGLVSTLLGLSLVAVAACLAISASSATPVVLVSLAAFFVSQSANMPILDILTYSLADRDGRRVDFGRVRKWGSVAFVAGNLLGGAALTAVAVTRLPPIMSLTAAVAILGCLYSRRLDAGARVAPRPAATNRAALGLVLGCVIAVEALVQSSHALLQTLGGLHWAAAGHSNFFIGVAWAVGVVTETLAFAVFGNRRVGPKYAAKLLALGAGSAVLRWIAMAFDPPGAVILTLQAMHGLTFAATHVGALELSSELAPPGSRGSVQGGMIALNGGLYAAFSVATGPLDGAFGQGAYFVMASLAAAGLALTAVIAARRPLAPVAA